MSKKKQKPLHLTLTVNMLLDFNFLDNEEEGFEAEQPTFKEAKKALLNQLVKVKTGEYENMFYGSIADVKLTENTEKTASAAS